MARAKFNSQVLGYVNSSSFRSRVRGRRIVANSTNTNTSNGSGDDHARRFGDSSLGRQKRSESAQLAYLNQYGGDKYDLLLNRVEHALDIQIHNLGEHLLGVSIEFLAPRRARIRKENVNAISRLRHLGNQPVQLFHVRAVGWDGDGLCARPFVGERIEGSDCFVAC